MAMVPQCNEAFDQLKEKLLSPSILSFPQFDKVFMVDTDASQHGIGAVLSQEGDRVITYASRILTKAERQYIISLGPLFCCSHGS